MLGSKFKLNEKTYVLIEEESRGACNGCAFENMSPEEGNLCSLKNPSEVKNGNFLICQSFDAIFEEVIVEAKKGIKKKLIL
jgi:hypothetical protein